MREFSTRYVSRIVSEVQDKHFIVMYHNCGSSVNQLVEPMLETGCIAFHFGETADMELMLRKIPRSFLVMGNISPSQIFNGNSVQKVKHATTRLLELTKNNGNFIISSGCDIPPYADLDNVDAFFDTVEAFYYRQNLFDIIA